MTVDDILTYLRGATAEACICGRSIPATAIYYAFPLADDADEPCAYINEWHEECLREWGWRRDDSEFGIEHIVCDEPVEA